MSKKQIHETAINLLNGKLAYIRTMIDRGNKYEYIDFNLTELQIQADFALSLRVISDDEHQELKEKWYNTRDLLNTIHEDA